MTTISVASNNVDAGPLSFSAFSQPVCPSRRLGRTNASHRTIRLRRRKDLPLRVPPSPAAGRQDGVEKAFSSLTPSTMKKYIIRSIIETEIEASSPKKAEARFWNEAVDKTAWLSADITVEEAEPKRIPPLALCQSLTL